MESGGMEFWLPMAMTAFGLILTGVQAYFAREQHKIMKAQLGSSKGKRGPVVILPIRRLIALWGVMAVLVGLAWVPYFLRDDDLPELGAEDRHGQWGITWAHNAGAGFCGIIANGDRYWKYRSRYQIASACLIDDGSADVLDLLHVQTSKLHEIRKGGIELRAQWGPGFFDYYVSKRAYGLTHFTLLVPPGVTTGSFSTLRQARSMGIRIVRTGRSNVGN